MSHAPNSPEQTVRVMQMIAGALAFGVVVFAAISVLAFGALSEDPDGQLVSLLAAVMTVVAFVGHMVVPNLTVQQALAEADPDDAASLYGVYQTQMIIRLSMLEGMAFFNIVACIMEHNWWSLALAGCLVVWMLMAFPSRGRVEQWIEAQRMNLGADDLNR